MKKILITGISGFAGSFLSEYLIKKKDIQLFGTIFGNKDIDNIDCLRDKIKLFECDIRNMDRVKEIIFKVKPDYLYHLAAFASGAGEDKEKIFKINVKGTLNILESCKALNKRVKILLASTGYVYGSNEDKIPFKETDPVSPIGFYAQSKLEMENEARKYLNSNLEIIITRAFNHTGPRQSLQFVIPSFAFQIANCEKSKQSEILVGNLEAVRDFSDVRDVVRAYDLILEKGKSGEIYNIATGRGWSIQEVLNKLLTFSKKKISIRKDPKRMRQSEIKISIGSFEKIKRITGWQPTIKLETTLKDTLNYWREK